VFNGPKCKTPTGNIFCAIGISSSEKKQAIRPVHHISFLFCKRGAVLFKAPRFWIELLDRTRERSLAQVGFRPGAPDHDLGHVLHVAGQHDFLLELVAEQ